VFQEGVVTSQAHTRPPAVAGAFYQAERERLAGEITAVLAESRPGLHQAPIRPKALIAPHAGYIYSGATPRRPMPCSTAQGSHHRVVLLGPTHRVWVPGLALPGVDRFRTPLGDIPLDARAISEIANLPQIEVNSRRTPRNTPSKFTCPSCRSVLGDFTLVPLAVGGATPDQVADVLEHLWGGPETLIVVSSDLSHFLPYAEAQTKDAATVEAMLDLDATLVGDRACGAHPVNGLLISARRKGLMPHLLDLRNSGDTAGDKQRVVGYAAIAFTESSAKPTGAATSRQDAAAERGEMLTSMARAAIHCEIDWQAGACVLSGVVQGTGRHIRHPDPERPLARLHRQPGSASSAGRRSA
jgi:AmmeMemoRadiSam system protein B